ncbi:MAG TPA: hypothetical protein VD931_04645 [Baekduia sp.]|nr:hypothetical protein [Baekduia sp.]
MDLAERALNAARHRLLDSGNPAFLAVAVVPGGPPVLGPLVVANPQAAGRGAEALEDAVPGAEVVVVGCARAGSHLRFTVRAAGAADVLLDRLEVRERPIGDMPVV